MPTPKTVTLEERQIKVDWSDGHRSIFSNKSPREACPCAECKGEEMPLGGRSFIPLEAATPEDTLATAHSRIGLYALAFLCSDGHSSGIYHYDYLLHSCGCTECTAKRGD